MNRLTSRKFLLAVFLIVTAIGSAVFGLIPWETSIETVRNTVLGYLAAEGAVDFAYARSTQTFINDPPPGTNVVRLPAKTAGIAAA